MLTAPEGLKIKIMALIKLSSIGITNISGKAGGSVFARNKGGAIVRNFAVPSNPSSEFQENVRGTFGAFAQQWRGLSESERSAWNNATDDYERVNVFGDNRKLSGISLFISLNQNLVQAGQSPITMPKAPQGTDAPLSLTNFVVEIQAIPQEPPKVSADLTYEQLAGALGGIVIIEATATASPGISNFSNRFRVVATEATTTSPMQLDFADEYVERFGTPLVGGKVAVRVKFLNPNTGETSAYVSANVVVTQAT